MSTIPKNTQVIIHDTGTGYDGLHAIVWGNIDIMSNTITYTLSPPLECPEIRSLSSTFFYVFPKYITPDDSPIKPINISALPQKIVDLKWGNVGILYGDRFLKDFTNNRLDLISPTTKYPTISNSLIDKFPELQLGDDVVLFDENKHIYDRRSLITVRSLVTDVDKIKYVKVLRHNIKTSNIFNADDLFRHRESNAISKYSEINPYLTNYLYCDPRDITIKYTIIRTNLHNDSCVNITTATNVNITTLAAEMDDDTTTTYINNNKIYTTKGDIILIHKEFLYEYNL